MKNHDPHFAKRRMIAPVPIPDSCTANMNEEELFSKALEFDSEEERARFLDDACRGLPDSRQNIEQLLRSHSAAGDFLLTPPEGLLETALNQICDGYALPRTNGNDKSGNSQPALDFLKPSKRADSLGRLGVYEVSEMVAHGGTGIVLRATDMKLDRTVALKVLKPHCLDWPSARASFLKEARAAAAIRSDHVVTIFAVEDECAVPFLVMEFVEGESLQQKLYREGPLALSEICQIGVQIASGLAATHSRNLIHRDVKPANILIEHDTDRALITDFGLARAVKESGDTPLGMTSGTPQYMSPEQAEGKHIDHRSDLFSLGSVLYALCTGRPPFRASNSLAALRRVVEFDPQPLNRFRQDLPPELVALIERLLEKKTDQRLQSADEVVRLLDAVNEGRFDGAAPVETFSKPVSTSSISTSSIASLAEEARGERPTVQLAMTDSQQSVHPHWNLITKQASLVIVGVVSLVAIILIIRSQNGVDTKFTLPEGADVSIDTQGRIAVELANVPEPRHPATGNSIPGTASPGSTSESTTQPSVKPVQKSIGVTSTPPPADVPFSSVSAKKHQTEWAKHLDVPVKLATDIGLTFSLIPPGEFDMGSTQAEVDALLDLPIKDNWIKQQIKTIAPNALPQHHVRITQPFYISQTEVTVGHFRQFVEVTGYVSQAESTGIGGTSYAKGLVRNQDPGWDWKNPGYKQTDAHPVVQVTWLDAVAFCEWFSQSSGMSASLPTEAQWEFACRAGSEQRMFFGSSELLLKEYIVRASPYGPKPVGSRHPNVFGLFDMYSNVWEWCSDYYAASYTADSPVSDPTGPSHGTSHSIRGGGYRTAHEALSSACRRAPLTIDLCSDNLGFRVAITGDLTRVNAKQSEE